jgi:hypothetical protein
VVVVYGLDAVTHRRLKVVDEDMEKKGMMWGNDHICQLHEGGRGEHETIISISFLDFWERVYKNVLQSVFL